MWKNRAVKLQYQMKSHALQILQRLVVRRLTIRLLASWRKAHTQLLSLLGTRATVVSELWFKNANLSRPFKAWQTEKLAEDRFNRLRHMRMYGSIRSYTGHARNMMVIVSIFIR